MKTKIYNFLRAGILLLLPGFSFAQVPTCDPSVPFYSVNLTGHPDSIWYSPGHSRNGNCCGTVSPDRCTSFEVLLDTGAAMINFNIASGAIPTGSMFYQIGCGPQIPVGQPICIVGPGPHRVTFCKPGNNQNTYMIQSIPKPIFPKTQHVRIGCHQNIKVLGMDTSTVTWTSVYPGAQGQYNSYLSCSSACINPVYTPAANAPAYIIYKICGTPLATACGYVAVCDTFRVYNEQPLSATVTPNPAGFCAGGGGVMLTASASGGYGAYSYIWRDQTNAIVGVGSTYNATAAGTYNVEVRDALYNVSSCPSIFTSVPVIVTNPPIVNAGVDQTLCYTSPTAYLSGTLQYATGAEWTGGAGTFSPSNTDLNASYTPTPAEMTVGSVTLTLTSTGAGGGCANAADEVVLHYPAQLTLTMPSVTVSCNNSTITLNPTVSGGVGPYDYSWSTSSNNSSILVGQGNYCVSVTDNIGCSANICANVVAPPALNLTMSSTIVSANGGSDGTATANPGGGTSPYSYNWNPSGQLTQTATGLSFGVYTCTVTDAKGCSIFSSIVVNEPRCASFTGSLTKDNVPCFGDHSGSATVTVSGGTGPYTYSWNDPSHQTTASASNLGAGTYLVVVTDGNGCLYSTSASILEPTQISNVMNQTNVTVVGGSNGSATANPTGGTPAYTYNWSNGGSTQSISSLSAGLYILNLHDTHNCALIDSVVITEGACQNLVLSTNSTNVSCKGGSDGSATATALHGTGPYTYSWSNGATTATVNNLAAGTYVVTVTDALNCSTFKNVTIAEPSALSIALAPTAISCSDRNDGTIELTVSGGTFPYSFNWSNGMTVEDLINLSDASYSVTVTDSKGCTATGSTSIVRPTELKIGVTYTNVTCNDGNNGAITIGANGGVLPYSYLWNTGSTSSSISGLTSGPYSVVVTDANGCKVNTPLGILIDQPDAVAIVSHTVSCPAPGSGVANVSLTPAGGWQGPYQVSFDNGVTFQAAGTYNMNLPVGTTYTVVIKDNNGCLSPISDVVAINPELSVSAVNFNKCYYGTTSATQVTVTPTGGNGGPYSVSFDGGANYQTGGAYIFNLPVDSNYNVVIKDSNNCTSVASAITLPAVMASTSTLSVYNTNNISCHGLSDGSISISTSGGTTPYAYSWSNGTTTQNQSNLSAGSYSVVVSDANNCRDTVSVTLTEPAVLASTITATTNFNGYNISCNGLSDAGIDLTVTGGVAAYGYQWSNSATSQDISGVGAGTYSVVITDANNCKDTASITLTEPAALTYTLNIASNYNSYGISCHGLSDGALNLTVGGGVTTYSYGWSNGATSQNISGAPAGNYSVTATDQNGCTISANATLTEPAALVSAISSVSNYNGYNISCAGLTNGNISITTNGGVTAYSYSWSNGSSSQNQTGLGAGSYSVVITDANNCKDTLHTTLTQPSALLATGSLAATYNGYAVSCNGSTNGGISISAIGGVPAYTYNWSNGSIQQNQNNLGAGVYSVAVTDQNVCTYTLSFTLTEPSKVMATAAIQNVLCNKFTNGGVDQTVTGGVSPYTYIWTNGSTAEDLTAVGAGSYSVTIIDANSCAYTFNYTITENSPIVMNVSHTNVTCNGLADASIVALVNGGTPAYNYQWSSGQTTSNLTMLGPGVYVLTVTDANQCTGSQTVTVTEPTVLTGSLSSPLMDNGHNVSFYNTTDGSVNSSISGGTTPYTYNWSNGASTANLNNIGAGSYTLTVTDQNGCKYTGSIVLTAPLELAMPSGISPNGDGLNDFFVVHGLEAYPNNSISIFNRWGNSVYEKDKYQQNWAGKNSSGADLPDGTYFVILKINNGDTTLTGYVDVRR